MDVAQEMMHLTLQIVAEALFSTDISASVGDVEQVLPTLLEYVTYRSLHPLALPERYPTPRNRRFLRARNKLDRLVYRLIEERRTSDDHPSDLLSMLLDAQDEETGERMTDEQLRDEVMTILLAGHETTAVALAWTWYLLAQHPQVEQKLHAELDAVLAGRTPTLEDLPRLSYTRMVIEEVMRLYPPAWAIVRQAAVDDDLHGFRIPAKSPVIVMPYVTHRHPDFWERPNAFEPERFAPGRDVEHHKFAYFPFGGGPRQCIGNNFALMEAQLILATLAQHYTLDLVPDHPVEPEPTVTLRPRYGIRTIVKPWKSAKPSAAAPSLLT